MLQQEDEETESGQLILEKKKYFSLKSVFNGLRRSTKEDPYKVQQTKKELYNDCEVIYDSDILTLYAFEDKTRFELVTNEDVWHSCCSVSRYSDRREAEYGFKLLNRHLPSFIPYISETNVKEKLQEICHVIRVNPTWSIAHIAAHCNLLKCFENSSFINEINTKCEETLLTPLHAAIMAKNAECVKLLLSIGSNINDIDQNGNVVFHHAAKSTKEIIQVLSAHSAKPVLINQTNNTNQTPLHIACVEEKWECVKELIINGADINSSSIHKKSFQSNFDSEDLKNIKEAMEKFEGQFHQPDIKYGGNPLHWAKTYECIDAMIKIGCDKNARNFQGNTVLLVMIAHNRLNCVVALLCHKINPDIVGEDGNTPLHIAAQVGDIALVQSLLVFGANVNIRNSRDESVRHVIATKNPSETNDTLLFVLHSMGAKRCHKEIIHKCTNSCSFDGTNNGVIPDKFCAHKSTKLYDKFLGRSVINSALDQKDKEKSKDRCRVLCLDGGGIRGLLSIQMLWVLENMVKTPIVNCFDWIVGSSTGGILSLALATGKSIIDCRSIYFNFKNKVFVGSRPYSSERFEQFLKQEFGEHAVMADITNKRVAVTGVLADRQPPCLHLFRNYLSPEIILGEENYPEGFQIPLKPSEQLIWKAARATGAAPTYFRASDCYLDGGLISNNPTLDALTEIHKYIEAHKCTGKKEPVENVELIVSLGTGVTSTTAVTITDLYRPESIFQYPKVVKKILALGQIVLNQAIEANGSVVDRAKAWCSMVGIPYFRLNPLLSEEVNMDETDDRVLVKMLWEATVYMISHKAELEDLVELLKS